MPIVEPVRETAATRVPRATLAFWLIAFLLAGLFATWNLSSWPVRISYPGDESYEGVALVEITQLRQGVPIYSTNPAQGFHEATYGPLYYILTSHLVNPSHPSYLPLRLLSLLGVLGCAAGCGLLAFWLSHSRAAALLSPVVFLSYGMVTGHGVTALSDSIALFLFFTGFLVAFRFRNSKAILYAVPFMILGFYYKPQYIAGPIAVFAFLMLSKRYRQALQFTGLLAAGGLVLFAYFQWIAFSGQEFWRHFLLYQGSLMSWHRFTQGFLIFGLLLAAAYLLAFDYLRSHPNRLLSCYAVAAIILGLITISKSGSDVHYFFESVLFVSATIPALLASRMRSGKPPVELLGLLAAVLFLGQWYTPTAPRPADFTLYWNIQKFLTGHFPAGSKALDSSPGDILQAGLQIPFTSLFQLSHLASRGIVSDRGLVSRIQDREFSLIVLNFDLQKEHDPALLDYFLTGPMRDAIASNYVLATSLEAPAPERFQRLDRVFFYVPKQAPGIDRQVIPKEEATQNRHTEGTHCCVFRARSSGNPPQAVELACNMGPGFARWP